MGDDDATPARARDVNEALGTRSFDGDTLGFVGEGLSIDPDRLSS
jgi:hypothetical protein